MSYRLEVALRTLPGRIARYESINMSFPSQDAAEAAIEAAAHERQMWRVRDAAGRVCFETDAARHHRTESPAGSPAWLAAEFEKHEKLCAGFRFAGWTVTFRPCFHPGRWLGGEIEVEVEFASSDQKCDPVMLGSIVNKNGGRRSRALAELAAPAVAAWNAIRPALRPAPGGSLADVIADRTAELRAVLARLNGTPKAKLSFPHDGYAARLVAHRAAEWLLREPGIGYGNLVSEAGSRHLAGCGGQPLVAVAAEACGVPEKLCGNIHDTYCCTLAAVADGAPLLQAGLTPPTVTLAVPGPELFPVHEVSHRLTTAAAHRWAELAGIDEYLIGDAGAWQPSPALAARLESGTGPGVELVHRLRGLAESAAGWSTTVRRRVFISATAAPQLEWGRTLGLGALQWRVERDGRSMVGKGNYGLVQLERMLSPKERVEAIGWLRARFDQLRESVAAALSEGIEVPVAEHEQLLHSALEGYFAGAVTYPSLPGHLPGCSGGQPVTRSAMACLGSRTPRLDGCDCRLLGGLRRRLSAADCATAGRAQGQEEG